VTGEHQRRLVLWPRFKKCELLQNSHKVPVDMHSKRFVAFSPKYKNPWGGLELKLGRRMMVRIIIDVVLFSCMFTFVTGIVLAAAHVLG
jgi:hypothetical protein